MFSFVRIYRFWIIQIFKTQFAPTLFYNFIASKKNAYFTNYKLWNPVIFQFNFNAKYFNLKKFQPKNRLWKTLLLTFRGLAMAGKSKPKPSTKIQLLIEAQNVNFWRSARYCQTLVGRCACSGFCFVKFINIFNFRATFC